MAKRIGFLIFSAAIIVTGIIAINRLHYWERSVRIFSMNNDQSFGRNFDRRRGGFENRGPRDRFERFEEGFERQDLRDLPDSVRQRNFTRRDSITLPDSLKEGRLGSFRAERRNFGNRNPGRDGRNGRGDFRRGNNIQLANVSWFFAVFALFTVVTIYIDKIIRILRQKRKTKNISS